MPNGERRNLRPRRRDGRLRALESRRRIAREKLTVRTMIEMYCSTHHKRAMCDACQMLYAYATLKIDKCPFHQAKPVCTNCTIHCYRSNERDQIKRVMRFSGPRMLIRHPVMALLHLIDGFGHSGSTQVKE